MLVVDDDRDIVELVSLALEIHGYRVRAAANGQEALAMLDQCPADLILLDLQMPVMDGWTFCREKRHRPRLDVIPLAVMSASGNLGERVRPCNPSALLEKPFAIDGLLRTVSTALAR